MSRYFNGGQGRAIDTPPHTDKATLDRIADGPPAAHTDRDLTDPDASEPRYSVNSEIWDALDAQRDSYNDTGPDGLLYRVGVPCNGCARLLTYAGPASSFDRTTIQCPRCAAGGG